MSLFYRMVGPIIRLLDPETAHGIALAALKRGWVPEAQQFSDPCLRTNVWGHDFANPVGLAAGFDKNAHAPDAMLRQGFGFVEVGSVTPRAQPGNPRPRLFRLTKDRGVINRNGFNNDGMDAMAAHLHGRNDKAKGWVGVNFGKNKDTEEALDDYVLGINRLAAFADYIVVNVSSPNTPGLRALQGKEPLSNLMAGVRTALNDLNLKTTPPVLLKVAPDLTDEDKRDIADVVLEQKIDGLIATNTTISRPESLKGGHKTQAGGLSGLPLHALSTRVLSDLYKLTEGQVPLVGVGGVGNAAQAYAKIRAGASLVQLYSAMVYEGPGIANDINKGLVKLLSDDGFRHVSDAVGADHK